MNLSTIDWAIVLGILILMIAMVLVSKNLVKSVTDFLATGRTGGRYIISMFQGTAALGAITVVGALEQNYSAGFNARWWEMLTAVILVGMSVSGWVVYRFRQTRALTMAQFFEMRYSKNFRIFSGFLAFTSGIINMVIFPSVSARFFIYFCGIPEIGYIGPFSGTFVLVTAAMVIIPLIFILTGGHIAVMFTDFIQGVFVNIVFVVITILLLFQVDWSAIAETMNSAPKDASLINPFHSGNVQDFNIWYFFIGMFGLIYTKLSWQGNSSFNVAAKSAHEAKMADVLTNWRLIPQWGLFLVFIPVVAYTVMNNPGFKSIADSVNAVLAGSGGTDAMRSQLRVPMVLNVLLPIGLKGAFVAIMLAAAITCHNTYMHSWGSIFVQDCLLPLKKRILGPQEHLRYLKLSITGVAVTIFILSILFQQTEKIFLFTAISGAIFVGGSGAAIIGGLYWKRGTTAAAWSAMITGAVTATSGIVLNSVIKDFPINGQWFWFIAMASASVVYFVVSIIGNKQSFDMDKLLNRGKYALKDEVKTDEQPIKGWKVLGTTKEFTKGDKRIYIATYVWTFAWFIVFVIGTVMNLTMEVSDSAWMTFWKYFIYIYAATSVIVVIWFLIGGARDLKEMIHSLKSMVRNHQDDGRVTH